MIKALSDNLVILGLSKINIERLQSGMPISINLKDLGLPDQPIVIFTGDTEKTMAKEMLAWKNRVKK